jgi:hypothetical protein
MRHGFSVDAPSSATRLEFLGPAAVKRQASTEGGSSVIRSIAALRAQTD